VAVKSSGVIRRPFHYCQPPWPEHSAFPYACVFSLAAITAFNPVMYSACAVAQDQYIGRSQSQERERQDSFTPDQFGRLDAAEGHRLGALAPWATSL